MCETNKLSGLDDVLSLITGCTRYITTVNHLDISKSCQISPNTVQKRVTASTVAEYTVLAVVEGPNGPKEILKDNINSIKYRSGDHHRLAEIIESILRGDINNELKLKLNMKKMIKNYTMIHFANKIKSILN